jgi:Fic family protein
VVKTKSTRPKSATSYKDSAFGIIPRSQVVLLEKEGVKKAQQYIISLSEQKAEITPDLIKTVHREGFGFIFPDWAGKWRTVDVTVGTYEPPHYSRVPELVKNLCDDFNERLKHLPSPEAGETFLAEAISLCAWFQHQFVWIHPFKDYNGRVARLLINLIFLELGFPFVTIKAETGKDREKYIAAMNSADEQDFTELESLIENALQESLEKA